jgi:hypothetical protein
MHPIVDGIEREYSKQLVVYRLDYRNPADARIAQSYAVRTHPVLLVIDTKGGVIKRWDGVVLAAHIREFVQHTFE